MWIQEKNEDPLKTSLIQAHITHPAEQRKMAKYGQELTVINALKLYIR